MIVSGDEAWQTINDYVSSVAPDLLGRLNKYEPPASDGPDVFAVHRIDEQLTKAMDRKVWLPSGGTLVIDRTEAMTVVDVNTGKFTGSGGNLEETVTRNNLEAAEEIVRQLRLRDIGGMVVIDFIDMVLESNRDLVLRRLTEALARDRTRHQVSEVTSLGLVQLTRKRLGIGLIEAFSTSCTHCVGRGIMLHNDPVESTSAGRKQESGGRRGRRSRKNKGNEPAMAKVPTHAPGEHPLFKAMAASSGKRDDDDDDSLTEEDVVGDDLTPEPIGEAIDEATAEQVAREVADEDLEDDDEFEDTEDEAEDDSDEADDEDEDDSDEVDEIDDDAGDDDEEEDELDVDLHEDDEVIDDLDLEPGADDAESESDDDQPQTSGLDPAATGGRRPRRTAARPAGPPVGGDAV